MERAMEIAKVIGVAFGLVVLVAAIIMWLSFTKFWTNK
jgi:hypothetical protein